MGIEQRQWPAKMQQRRRKIDSNFTAETSNHTYKGTARKKGLKTLKNPGNSFTYKMKKAISGLQHKNDENLVYTVQRNNKRDEEQKLPKKLTITTLC